MKPHEYIKHTETDLAARLPLGSPSPLISPPHTLPVAGPPVLTWTGALIKAFFAVLAKYIPVCFKEILCFIKDILDFLQ